MQRYVQSLTFLAFSCSLFSQMPVQPVLPLERLGVEQGMPQGFVTEMLQDREGFLWTGGANTGLSRYDGHRFKRFTADPFDPHSLSGDFVISIGDMEEFLFVGTMWDGANLFHKKTGRFFRLPFEKMGTDSAAAAASAPLVLEKLPGPAVHFIHREAGGDLWLWAFRFPGYYTWFCRMEVPDGFWERLPYSSKKEQEHLISSVKYSCQASRDWAVGVLDDGKTVFMIKDTQMFAWQGKGWNPLPVPLDFIKKLDIHFGPKPILPDNFWQTADGEIWRSEGGGTRWSKVGSVPADLKLVSLQGHLAWAKRGYEYLVFPFQPSPFRIDFLKPLWTLETEDGRLCFLFDHTGNFWCTNQVSGLLKFSPEAARFNTIDTDGRFLQLLLINPEGSLFNFWEDNGFHFYGESQDQAVFLQTVLNPDNQRGGFVHADCKGRVWFHKGRELKMADPRSKTLKEYLLPHESPMQDCQFLVEKSGTLWLPNGGVLIRFEPDKGQAIGLDFRHLGFLTPEVKTLSKTRDGSVWLGLEEGLLRIYSDFSLPTSMSQIRVAGSSKFIPIQFFKAKTKFYQVDPANRNSLNCNNIASLLTDPGNSNVLWIGTKGGGLNRLDLGAGEGSGKPGEKFTHLTLEQGLPDNVVYGILAASLQPLPKGGESAAFTSCFGEGKEEALWLSTNKGLVRYTPATGAMKNFRKADGLQADEFNTGSFAKGADGKLYFGGVKGMNIFHPAAITDNPHKPDVFITGLKINNLPIEPGDSSGILKEGIEFCRELVLPYSMNSITLEFAALDFTASSKNRYRYHLQGAEFPSAHETHEPSATYIGLRPGNYIFIVYGSNNDGVFSDEPARLKITILPPWYRTIWAYLACAAFVAGLFYWFLKNRMNELRLEIDLEKKKNEVREAALAYEQKRREALEILQKLETERREAEIKREADRQKLEDFTSQLLEKSQQLCVLQALLAKSEAAQTAENDSDAPPLHRQIIGELYQGQILKQEDWEKWRQLFELAHPGFSQKLSNHYPNLTVGEMRLLLLTKIGVKRADAAFMLGVTAEAVKRASLRLRKKLGLDDQPLEVIFNNL